MLRVPCRSARKSAKIDEYLALAKEGSDFLVSMRRTKKLHRAQCESFALGMKFAEKYNRFTIEELE